MTPDMLYDFLVLVGSLFAIAGGTFGFVVGWLVARK